MRTETQGKAISLRHGNSERSANAYRIYGKPLQSDLALTE